MQASRARAAGLMRWRACAPGRVRAHASREPGGFRICACWPRRELRGDWRDAARAGHEDRPLGPPESLCWGRVLEKGLVGVASLAAKRSVSRLAAVVEDNRGRGGTRLISVLVEVGVLLLATCGTEVVSALHSVLFST